MSGQPRDLFDRCCARSASTAISGSFSVRRDRFVLASPCARTERPTEIVPPDQILPFGMPNRSQVKSQK